MKALAFASIAAASAAGYAAASEPWMEKSVAALRTEKKIKDVRFSNDSPMSLWISVKDDGTRRDGYAEYACLVLHQNGKPSGSVTVIHIWDAAAMARGQQRELGNFECDITE